MQLADWLNKQGLGELRPVLEDNGVDLEALTLLEYEHLSEMGISVGARLKLLKAIASNLGRPGDVATTALPRPDAERRQLTTMFCDIIGYTNLSAELDPEETRRLLRAHWEVVKRTTLRHGGHIAQYLGDGALIYFGYPAAQEDDAERAVNAALSLLSHYQAEEGEGVVDLHLRIGIATGPVVIGVASESRRRPEDLLAVGSHVNLASRLQSLAMPGNLLIDEVTRDLVGDLFMIEPLGRQAIAGLDDPQRIFRVVAPRRGRSRFEAQRSSHAKVLLGRRRETDMAMGAWRETLEGRCHVVLVEGEPGIGKSHFVWSVSETIASYGFEVIQLQCSPGQANTPFYPLAEKLIALAGVSPGDDDDEKSARLAQLVEDEAGLSVEDIDVLGGLFDLQGRSTIKPQDNPVLWRQLAFKALRRFFVGRARTRSLLVLIEDLHWCDPTTIEFFRQLVSDAAALPMLLVATMRPEGRQAPALSEEPIRIRLERMSLKETASFIDTLLDGDVPMNLSELVFDRTDGVPLFVEELTKAIREESLLLRTADGVGLREQLDAGDVPSSLHGVLMARLDRLGPHKRLAQVASCIGRSFSLDLLAQAAGLDAQAMQDGLVQLQASELIIASPGPSGPQLMFRHALIRDAAYGTMLAPDRRDIHHHIAGILLGRERGDGARRPESLAFHLARAGRFEEAIGKWREAAVAAKYRSASEEAIAHLHKGLDLLARVPDTARREELEFSLLIELVAPYRSVRGFAAPEVGEITQRAIQLADQARDVQAILPLLYNQWVYKFVTAHRDDGEALIAELFARCSYDHGNVMRMTAHRARAANDLLRGRFMSAKQDFDASIAHYDPRYQAPITHSIGLDALVTASGYNALACWCLGDTNSAERNIERALAHSALLEHAGSQAFSAYHEALLRGVLMQQPDVMIENGRRLQEVGFRHHFSMWMACGRLLEAMGASQKEPGPQAVQLVAQRLREFQDMGLVYLPSYETFIARRWLELERVEEGLAHVVRARAIMGQSGERWNEAEIDRTEAELCVQADCRTGKAAELLQRAVDVARTQQARPFAGRAEASLRSLPKLDRAGSGH